MAWGSARGAGAAGLTQPQGDATTAPRVFQGLARRAWLGGLCAAALGLAPGCAQGGGEEPVLSGQRAYLFDVCPRARALEAQGPVKAPARKRCAAATATMPSPASAKPFQGSGLVVLADWLDAPVDTGARRWAWQHADCLAASSATSDTSEPSGACLVLVGGRFKVRPDTTNDPSDPVADCPPPPKAQARFPAPPACGSTPEARPCCIAAHGLEWSQSWLERYGLADAPEVYAEIAIEHTAAGIRLRPKLWEIAPPADPALAPDDRLHASLYAAIWLGGEELGLTAFKLPSRPARVVTLFPEDFDGSGGLWLPVPAGAGGRDVSISILAVLHESRRESDADGHVVRALATARNTSLPPIIPCMPTPMPGARVWGQMRGRAVPEAP